MLVEQLLQFGLGRGDASGQNLDQPLGRFECIHAEILIVGASPSVARVLDRTGLNRAMTSSDAGFLDRYGPWAVIGGASEGIGAAYARAMAERGLNVVLLARRAAQLDEVAEGIRADFGVQAKTVALDLTHDDAVSKIFDATAGLEVGTLFYGAGGTRTISRSSPIRPRWR